jgi:hypothetical protein
LVAFHDWTAILFCALIAGHVVVAFFHQGRTGTTLACVDPRRKPGRQPDDEGLPAAGGQAAPDAGVTVAPHY